MSETLFLDLCPAIQNLFYAIRREASRQAMLETQLQIQARYRRAGARSREAAERQLTDFPWPADPCSKSADPIRFLATDKGLKLWCIGQDGIDQQAEAADAPPAVAKQIDDLVVIIPWPNDGTTE